MTATSIQLFVHFIMLGCVVATFLYKYMIWWSRTQFGRCAFSVCGPDIWNSLPVSVRLIDSHPSFRRALKTHLLTLLLFSLFAHVWTFVMHSRSVLCMTAHYNFYYVCMYVSRYVSTSRLLNVWLETSAKVPSSECLSTYLIGMSVCL